MLHLAMERSKLGQGALSTACPRVLGSAGAGRVQVHAQDLADVREALNTLAHTGPDTVAAVSQDLQAALAALPDAHPAGRELVTRRGTPQAARLSSSQAQSLVTGSTATSASASALSAQLSSQLRTHVTSGIEAVSAHLQQHGELSARATNELLRSSNAYVSSARQSVQSIVPGRAATAAGAAVPSSRHRSDEGNEAGRSQAHDQGTNE